MRSFSSAFGTEAEIQTEIFLIEVNPRQWGERETPIAGLATTRVADRVGDCHASVGNRPPAHIVGGALRGRPSLPWPENFRS